MLRERAVAVGISGGFFIGRRPDEAALIERHADPVSTTPNNVAGQT
jgi:hypothetical protein